VNASASLSEEITPALVSLGHFPSGIFSPLKIREGAHCDTFLFAVAMRGSSYLSNRIERGIFHAPSPEVGGRNIRDELFGEGKFSEGNLSVENVRFLCLSAHCGDITTEIMCALYKTNKQFNKKTKL